MAMLSKNFTDLVTFSRASGGTSFRPVGRGTLVNQLLWSNDFSNAAWVKTKATIQPSAQTFNGLAVSKLVETAEAGQKFVRQLATLPQSTHTTAFIAKASERSWAMAYMEYGASPGIAYFDLANVATGNVAAGATAGIVSLGDGVIPAASYD